MGHGDSITQIAGMMSESLTNGNESEATRVAFDFVRQFDAAATSEKVQMVSERPAPTTDPRYDALLGALVEHLCARWEVPVPAWVQDPDRFLSQWWFVSGLRSLHASALAQSPISFARRGVFICDGALTYA
jgi:hypothetical protein